MLDVVVGMLSQIAVLPQKEAKGNKLLTQISRPAGTDTKAVEALEVVLLEGRPVFGKKTLRGPQFYRYRVLLGRIGTKQISPIKPKPKLINFCDKLPQKYVKHRQYILLDKAKDILGNNLGIMTSTMLNKLESRNCMKESNNTCHFFPFIRPVLLSRLSDSFVKPWKKRFKLPTPLHAPSLVPKGPRSKTLKGEFFQKSKSTISQYCDEWDRFVSIANFLETHSLTEWKDSLVMVVFLHLTSRDVKIMLVACHKHQAYHPDYIALMNELANFGSQR
ncbi:unnamed protein product [Cylindrotheca closterium]|uniref:Uncharacterized protein n=1 Tax=Cylindrotheca closterium TaxID=2856 RepID=A0AAD2G7Q5_9STRA|nr:unnamed protein product [Cylindrotheca closterium]